MVDRPARHGDDGIAIGVIGIQAVSFIIGNLTGGHDKSGRFVDIRPGVYSAVAAVVGDLAACQRKGSLIHLHAAAEAGRIAQHRAAGHGAAAVEQPHAAAVAPEHAGAVIAAALRAARAAGDEAAGKAERARALFVADIRREAVVQREIVHRARIGVLNRHVAALDADSRAAVGADAVAVEVEHLCPARRLDIAVDVRQQGEGRAVNPGVLRVGEVAVEHLAHLGYDRRRVGDSERHMEARRAGDGDHALVVDHADDAAAPGVDLARSREGIALLRRKGHSGHLALEAGLGQFAAVNRRMRAASERDAVGQPLGCKGGSRVERRDRVCGKGRVAVAPAAEGQALRLHRSGQGERAAGGHGLRLRRRAVLGGVGCRDRRAQHELAGDVHADHEILIVAYKLGRVVE